MRVRFVAIYALDVAEDRIRLRAQIEFDPEKSKTALLKTNMVWVGALKLAPEIRLSAFLYTNCIQWKLEAIRVGYLGCTRFSAGILFV